MAVVTPNKQAHELDSKSDDARIRALKAEIAALEKEEQDIIKTLRGDGTPKEILAQHVKKLHQYNEIKDAGQLLLGKDKTREQEKNDAVELHDTTVPSVDGS
ncbi:hypothetical protein BGZ73_003015 [Actinomortierella ambigua]|nr:hypothetical protein BGZ73_003015 [Actinomortierella ambigua]